MINYIYTRIPTGQAVRCGRCVVLPGALVLLLSFGIVGSGCATYGVDPTLKPYSKLTRTSDNELRQEAYAILQVLEVNKFQLMESTEHMLCRVEDGFYLTAVKDDMPDIEKSFYIGATPEEAVDALIEVRQSIAYQQAAAQDALAQAMSVAAEGFSQGMSETPNATSYSPVAPATAKPSPVPQTTSPKHWISEVFSSGGYILLENNSVWKVDAIDRIYTALWLPLSDIIVKETTYQGYAFHELINVDDGELVSATYLGTLALRTRMKGEFKGWEGETVFPLQNGQVLQQASYAYHYHYAYTPTVLLLDTDSPGIYTMIVDGVEESIYVHLLG